MGSIHDQIIVTKTLSQTQAFAGDIAKGVQKRLIPHVICLYGELGAGKTAFAQGFIRAFGVMGRILSPTFTIVRQYRADGKKTVYHADCYRIDHEDDPAVRGIIEAIGEPGSVVVIEWAERIKVVLPHNRLDIRCRALADGTHEYAVGRVS